MARTKKKPEPLPALMHDAGSEKALLSLIFRHGLNELVEALDPADFADPWNNWIFRELRLMWESGTPLDCGAAASRWFSDPACGVRAKEAKITEPPAYVTAYVFKEEFVSLAHKDWLVQQIRKQRMRRWLAQLPGAIDKWNKENQDDPIATLKKVHRAIDVAWARAAEVFPEDLLCDD